MSAAPVSSTSANAISVTARTLRSENGPLSRGDLEFSLMTRFRSERETCMAGIRPQTIPVIHAMVNAIASMTGESPTSSNRAKLCGANERKALTPATATAYPQPPPNDRMTLSIRSCRSMRRRLAPSAARICNLALSLNVPGEYEVTYIGAGDQQKETHGREQHQQKPS